MHKFPTFNINDIIITEVSHVLIDPMGSKTKLVIEYKSKRKSKTYVVNTRKEAEDIREQIYSKC